MINKHNINKVLNKLPKDKVELEKVQLSVADDLQRALADGKKMEEDIKELISEIKADNQLNDALDKQIKARAKASMKLVNSSDNFQDKIKTASDNLDTALSKAFTAAKELGVKPEAIKGYKEADKINSKLMSETYGSFVERYFKGYDWVL